MHKAGSTIADRILTRTDRWLGRIADFLDQPITPALSERLAALDDFRVDLEDVSRHKRQVRPGGHTRKLKPETIAEMTVAMGRGRVRGA